MDRFLFETGTASFDADGNKVWFDQKIGRSDDEALQSVTDGRMTVLGRVTYLDVSVVLLLELQEVGLLSPTLDTLDQRPKFRRQNVDDFPMALNPQASSLLAVDEDVGPIVEAAIRVRCPGIDIIQLIISDDLPCYRPGSEANSLRAIGISKTKLKAVLPPLQMPAISKGDASRRLRVTYQSIDQFWVVWGAENPTPAKPKIAIVSARQHAC